MCCRLSFELWWSLNFIIKRVWAWGSRVLHNLDGYYARHEHGVAWDKNASCQCSKHASECDSQVICWVIFVLHFSIVLCSLIILIIQALQIGTCRVWFVSSKTCHTKGIDNLSKLWSFVAHDTFEFIICTKTKVILVLELPSGTKRWSFVFAFIHTSQGSILGGVANPSCTSCFWHTLNCQALCLRFALCKMK
jgi:hypothetical protein